MCCLDTVRFGVKWKTVLLMFFCLSTVKLSTHIPCHCLGFAWWFFKLRKRQKHVYVKKSNYIQQALQKHCRKCKWDVNRSKWSVTVHDSGILLELQNHPLSARVSKRSEYLQRLQTIPPRWTCDSRKKCTFKSLWEDVDTLHHGRRIILMDTNCHRANPQATSWQCHPESAGAKGNVTFPAFTGWSLVSWWVYAPFTSR